MRDFHLGDVVVAGKPAESEMLRRAALPVTDKEVMPPIKGGAQRLSDGEREILRGWIAAGASFGDWVKFDHRGSPLAAAPTKTNATDLTAKIDARVAAHHAKSGTHLNAPTDDETFLRRVYLDAIGTQFLIAVIQSPACSRRWTRWRGGRLPHSSI